MLRADDYSVLAFIALREAMFHGSPRRDTIRQSLQDADVDAALRRLISGGLINRVRRKPRAVVFTTTDQGLAALTEWQRGAPKRVLP